MTAGELKDLLKDADRSFEIAIGDCTITEVRIVPSIKEVKLIRGWG